MPLRYPPLRLNRELGEGLLAIQEKRVGTSDARPLLGTLLQAALQLEFSTVPVYLSAAFSLTDENESIADLIARVAQEEMLHMAVVANLMNACSIPPDIKGSAPVYPYSLDALDPPIRLDLKSFSLELVEDMFMRIETPEEPRVFPELSVLTRQAPRTIGQFYEAIIDIIRHDRIPDLFKDAERDLYKQVKVVPNFRPVAYTSNDDSHDYPLPGDIDFVIDAKDAAVRHLVWLVQQGEGSVPNPLSSEGLPGHYYRFESILREKYLVTDPNVREGYSYSGGDLLFSPSGVHEFAVNAKEEDYINGSRVRVRMNEFNKKYTQMVDHLHSAFNCPSSNQQQQAAEEYESSLQIMRGLQNKSSQIISAAAQAGVKAGIPFQYGLH